MRKIVALILIVSLLSLVSCAKMGDGEGKISVPTESSSIKTEPTVSETELVSEPEMGDTDVESIPVEPEPPESEPEEPETEEIEESEKTEHEGTTSEPDTTPVTPEVAETDPPAPVETPAATQPETTKKPGGYVTLPRDEF